MATQQSLRSASAASTFRPSFASCGVDILSKAMDEELLVYLQDHSRSAIDSFSHLVEIFKHLQGHPLLSDYLHAQDKSTTDGGDGDGKQAGEKEKEKASSHANTTTTIMTDHASDVITYKQFSSRRLLKNFIRRSFVKALILLHLQEKSLATQQQQTEASGTTTTIIKEPHAVAFASLCEYLGMELMPSLDDIHVLEEDEEDAEEEDKDEMEGDGEEEEGWVVLSRKKDDGDRKQEARETMVVIEEKDEREGQVAREIDGKGKEEGEKVRGTIAAPNTIVVKKRKCISLMPTGLKGVWILTPMLQQHLIQVLWQDETRSTATRYDHVYQTASLFRDFQDDANICALLASRSSPITGTAVAPDPSFAVQQRQISTIPELREFLLQPPVKAKLLEHVQKKRNTRFPYMAIKLVLLYVGLKMTEDFTDVIPGEPYCVSQARRWRRGPRPSTLLSHAPSLSVDLQKFIIDIFKTDTSRTKSTNQSYLSVLNSIWHLLEIELAGDAAASSSSGFPLTPPLATPQDLRNVFLENTALKGCFLSLLEKKNNTLSAKRVLLDALGLEVCWGEDDTRETVKKKTEEGHPTLEEEEEQGPAQGASSGGGGGGVAGSATGVAVAGEATGVTPKIVADRRELTKVKDKKRPTTKKSVTEDEEDQEPAKAARTDTGDGDTGGSTAAAAARITTRSQVGVGIAGETARLQHRRRETRHGTHILPAPLQCLRRRETRHGTHILSAPLQSLQTVLIDYQSSTTYENRQHGLVLEGLRLIYEQNEYVMRFASELLVGAPPLLELRGDPYKRRDLACWYLQLILEGVFNVLAATDSVQEG